MAFTFGSNTGGALAANATALTKNPTATAGDLLVWCITIDSTGGVTSASPSANANITWGPSVITSAVGNSLIQFLVYGVYVNSGNPSLSVSFIGGTGVGAGGGRYDALVFHPGGTISASTVLDKSNSTNGTASNAQVSLVGVTAGDLCVFSATNNSNTAFSGILSSFTDLGSSSPWNTNNRTGEGYLLSSGGGSVTNGYSTPASTNYNVIAASFIAPASASVVGKPLGVAGPSNAAPFTPMQFRQAPRALIPNNNVTITLSGVSFTWTAGSVTAPVSAFLPERALGFDMIHLGARLS